MNLEFPKLISAAEARRASEPATKDEYDFIAQCDYNIRYAMYQSKDSATAAMHTTQKVVDRVVKILENKGYCVSYRLVQIENFTKELKALITIRWGRSYGL